MGNAQGMPAMPAPMRKLLDKLGFGQKEMRVRRKQLARGRCSVRTQAQSQSNPQPGGDPAAGQRVV